MLRAGNLLARPWGLRMSMKLVGTLVGLTWEDESIKIGVDADDQVDRIDLVFGEVGTADEERIALTRREARELVRLLSLGAGAEAPGKARSAGSEVPSVARHPHPLVTTATLPARTHPPSNQPSSARGEGTPSNVPVCAVCQRRLAFAANSCEPCPEHPGTPPLWPRPRLPGDGP